MTISTRIAFSLLILPAAISSVVLSVPARSAQPTVAKQPIFNLAQITETESNANIIRLLEAGSDAYWTADDEASAGFYQQALDLIEKQVSVSEEAASKETDLWLKVQALHGLGRAYGQLQNYDLATPSLEAALALLESDGLESDRLEAVFDTAPQQFGLAADAQVTYVEIKIDLYGMLGAIAKDTGGYATSLGLSQAALALAQANNRLEEVAIFYHLRYEP